MKKKYVKDYVLDEKGKYQYQGEYYLCRFSEEERKKSSRIQTGYGIAAWILILLALSIPCVGSHTIYVVIPLEITLLCQGYHLLGSLYLRKIPDRMEKKEYEKAWQTPLQTLTVALFFYVFSLGGQVIVLFQTKTENMGDLYFCLILILLLLLSVLIWDRERKLGKEILREEKK